MEVTNGVFDCRWNQQGKYYDKLVVNDSSSNPFKGNSISLIKRFKLKNGIGYFWQVEPRYHHDSLYLNTISYVYH